MNTRDFCFWLQGFCELTVDSYPTEKQLNLIKEHLDLTKEVDRSGYYSFDHFCDTLDGFFSINGLTIALNQWDNIVNHLQAVFIKVTSELEDEETEKKSDDWEKIIKDVLDERRKCDPPYPPPPFIPPPSNPWKIEKDPFNPWIVPDVICSPGTGEPPDHIKYPVRTTCDAGDLSSLDKACRPLNVEEQKQLQDAIKAAENTIKKIHEHSNRKCSSDTVFCASVGGSLEQAYDQVQMDEFVMGEYNND